MRSGSLAVAAISLLGLVAAQPNKRRHGHERKHKNLKKDEVVVTVLDTVYAQPTEIPEVIVYVNQFGDAVSTTTEYLPVAASVYSTAFPATPSAISSSVSSSSSSTTTPAAAVDTAPAPVVEIAVPTVDTPAVVAAPTTSETPAPAVTEAPAAVKSEAAATTSSAPVDSPAPVVSTRGDGFGVVYSPYNADNSCKSQDQVSKDFETVGPAGYSLVRTYGVDCNQVSTVLKMAKKYNFKLFAGIWSLDSLPQDVATLAFAANGDWSAFDTISVGNELVNSGSASPEKVVAAIWTVRALLKAAGYNGNVVTVDTLVAARAHPSIVDASDYAAVNAHPFFDGNCAAGDSGDFLKTQIPTLSAVLQDKNKRIMITETGWPWKGESNGAAVPSLNNQASALSSIKSAFSSNKNDVILFTAFNDMWKTNSPAQFQAEQYWGMGGQNPPSG